MLPEVSGCIQYYCVFVARAFFYFQIKSRRNLVELNRNYALNNADKPVHLIRSFARFIRPLNSLR